MVGKTKTVGKSSGGGVFALSYADVEFDVLRGGKPPHMLVPATG